MKKAKRAKKNYEDKLDVETEGVEIASVQPEFATLLANVTTMKADLGEVKES